MEEWGGCGMRLDGGDAYVRQAEMGPYYHRGARSVAVWLFPIVISTVVYSLATDVGRASYPGHWDLACRQLRAGRISPS